MKTVSVVNICAMLRTLLCALLIVGFKFIAGLSTGVWQFCLEEVRKMYQQNSGGFHGRPLSEDQLQTLVPSVFARTAHPERSERFAPIPTIEILRGLRKEGFEVFSARQMTCRDASRKPFAKHLLRMRKVDAVQQVGDTFFEILLKNANDGTSIYDLFGGLFRAICMNGAVANDKAIGSVKVRHSGDVMNKVIEGTYTVMDSAQRLLEAPKVWGAINLSHDEQIAYAESAHTIRFADAEGNVNTSIEPSQMLKVRRREDTGTDLWSTFNVVQENMLRGGLTGFGTDANNRPRRQTTRAVNGIDTDLKLNRALWQLTQKMAELKA